MDAMPKMSLVLMYLCGTLVFVGAYSGPADVSTVRDVLMKPSSCTGKWAELPHSTMCQYEDSPDAYNCGVSEADKRRILSLHNSLRASVDPSQRNMMKMHWDDDLAALAQKWARVCSLSNDKYRNREVPGWGKSNSVAQMMAWGSGTWESAISLWWSKRKDFTYGRSIQPGSALMYMIMARDEANLVGCGYCKCGSTKPYYICNYYKGPKLSDKGHPYQRGSPCADCQRCINGLCECGDKVCKNGGTLNSRTCQCECRGKWLGSDCGTYDCPRADDRNCGPGRYYPPSDCEDYINVPDICPYMCGLCKVATSAPVRTTPKPVDCEDSNPICPEWARSGLCESNPGWMLRYCKASCNVCGGATTTRTTATTTTTTLPTTITTTIPAGCEDSNPMCPEWAAAGLCQRNPSWMNKYCKASCGTCNPGTTQPPRKPTPPPGRTTTARNDDCKDSNQYCADWARNGECKRNPAYMLVNCKKSCNSC